MELRLSCTLKPLICLPQYKWLKWRYGMFISNQDPIGPFVQRRHVIYRYFVCDNSDWGKHIFLFQIKKHPHSQIIKWSSLDDLCTRSRYQGQGQVITLYLWDVITFPCPWYLLLAHQFPFVETRSRITLGHFCYEPIGLWYHVGCQIGTRPFRKRPPSFIFFWVASNQPLDLFCDCSEGTWYDASRTERDT